MGENINKTLNHRRKKNKNKISKKDGPSSRSTTIPSDPWSEEQDIDFNSPISVSNPTSESNNLNLSFLFSGELDETELKEKEIDLYNDLVMTEDIEKKSKIKQESEFESLKKELEKLKEADARWRAKNSELLKENSHLKKSICSLYMTVKSEIEHKDQLLAEANRKIDNLLFWKKRQIFQREQDSKNQAKADTNASDKNSHKRKRSIEEPQSSAIEKRNVSSDTKSKNSNSTSSTKKVSENNNHKSNDVHNQPVKDPCKEGSEAPTLETVRFSENLRDSTETSNLFFNLIPPPLKKAFCDYEQSQIISLNRLKQSFVNEYFKSGGNVASKGFQFDPKKFKPQEYSVENNPENYSNQKSISDKCNKEKHNKITKSLQQDLVSLFKYKKERIPFLDKRKFGLLKEGKDLVPESLL